MGRAAVPESLFSDSQLGRHQNSSWSSMRMQGIPWETQVRGTGQRREEPKSEGDQRTHQSRGFQWEIMKRRGTECDFRSPLSEGAWVPTLTRNC